MTAAILLLALGLCLIAAEVLFPSFGVLAVLAWLAALVSPGGVADHAVRDAVRTV